MCPKSHFGSQIESALWSHFCFNKQQKTIVSAKRDDIQSPEGVHVSLAGETLSSWRCPHTGVQGFTQKQNNTKLTQCCVVPTSSVPSDVKRFFQSLSDLPRSWVTSSRTSLGPVPVLDISCVDTIFHACGLADDKAALDHLDRFPGLLMRRIVCLHNRVGGESKGRAVQAPAPQEIFLADSHKEFLLLAN